MAAAPKQAYQCSECGWTALKWVGRCGQCQEWGTVTESTPGAHQAGPRTTATSVRTPATPIGEVDAERARFQPTGVSEFDRVLGGGFVPGAVVLLAGEPGVGKSTLVLDAAAHTAAEGRTVLYITGEESASQVRLRAERIGALQPSLLLAAETDLGAVLAQIEQVRPDLLIVDSVQTIASAQVDSTSGSVTQVREVAASLIAVAKRTDLPVVLVGHVTKDGSIAGPRVLEHLVDVVCQFEGDKHAQLRLVRALKNRFGTTDEVGCFTLTESGIHSLPDPSGLFLSGARHPVSCTCVTIPLDGRRPMPIEVQALVAPTPNPHARRTTSGVDSARLAMTLAVLQARYGITTTSSDVYVSTVGGSRAVEPATDLAVALAVASARADLPTTAGMVAVGEVGLAGELRTATGTERRLNEARRLGFHTAIVPRPRPGAEPVQAPAGMQILQAEHLGQALEFAQPRPRPVR